MNTQTRLRACAALLATAAMLGACGGDDDTTTAAAPAPAPVPAPAPSPTPVPAPAPAQQTLPASATASAAGLFAYLSSLIGSGADETSEPIVLGDAGLPVDDSAEPAN